MVGHLERDRRPDVIGVGKIDLAGDSRDDRMSVVGEVDVGDPHRLDAPAHHDLGSVLVGVDLDRIHRRVDDRQAPPAMLALRWAPAPRVGDDELEHPLALASAQLEVGRRGRVRVLDRVRARLGDREHDLARRPLVGAAVAQPAAQGAPDLGQHARVGTRPHPQFARHGEVLDRRRSRRHRAAPRSVPAARPRDDRRPRPSRRLRPGATNSSMLCSSGISGRSIRPSV